MQRRRVVSPIRTLVVEPQAAVRQMIGHTLQDHPEYSLVGLKSNASEAVYEIRAHRPDLLFINTELPDQSAFALLDNLSLQHRPKTIFMSRHLQHAITALQYSALDFLKQPLQADQLNTALRKIILNWKINNIHERSSPIQEQRRISIRTGNKVIFLEYDQIDFISGSGYYIEFHTDDKKYLMRKSLTDILANLSDNRFKRIHRSTIINLDHMKEIVRKGPRKFFVKMKTDHLLRISSSYRKELYQELNI